MGFTLGELVDRVPPNTEDRVRYVKREFSKKIHSILRAETGFRLSAHANRSGSSKRTISVPVEIVPGVPEELADLKIPDDQELPMHLAPCEEGTGVFC